MTNSRTSSNSLQSIGPYYLGSTLGNGSFAKVKLGTHCETNEKVAIKIIKKENISLEPEMMSKVRREIAVQKLIKHPNVLRVYDVYETSEFLYIVLEYISGGELFDYIVKKGSLPRDEARVCFQEIVYAIEYCHSFCIAHRDLKPENLLLDDSNKVKVADFGMARIMKKDNLLETSCGSPHYVSPEVIKGVAYDGQKSDIWSMGVILYALLCGYLPFDDSNYSKLLRKVKLGKFKIPNKLNKLEKELIKGMLTIDPEKRITIQEIKKHPWFCKNFPEKYIPPSPTENFEKKFLKPFDSKKIDKNILRQLIELDCGTKEKIIEALKKKNSNIIKIFYSIFEKQTDKTKNEIVKKRRRRGSLPPNSSYNRPRNLKKITNNIQKERSFSNSFNEKQTNSKFLFEFYDIIKDTESNKNLNVDQYSKFINQVDEICNVNETTDNNKKNKNQDNENNSNISKLVSDQKKESNNNGSSGSSNNNTDNKINNNNSNSKNNSPIKAKPKTRTSKRRWSFSRTRSKESETNNNNSKKSPKIQIPSSPKQKTGSKLSSSPKISDEQSFNKNKTKITLPIDDKEKKGWFDKFFEKKKKKKLDKKLKKKLIKAKKAICDNLKLTVDVPIDVLDDRMLLLTDKPLLELITQLQISLTILSLDWCYPNLITLIGKSSKFEVKIKIKKNVESNKLKKLLSPNVSKKNNNNNNNNNTNQETQKNDEKNVEEELQQKPFRQQLFKDPNKSIIHFIWVEGSPNKFRDEITNLIYLLKL
ncbi:protein kinase [Anaeramoeba flamelloides]|uniref:Protein kinase n=1 Tax=Anaeramoeba flamelloides TaxID=1746091 RepID=A0AAV7ZPD7_9EUKA|nr:protein kinase [Anaeramoeba flamelloides]